MSAAGFHEAIHNSDQNNQQEQGIERLPHNADFVQCAPSRQFWRKAFSLASKGMLEIRNLCIQSRSNCSLEITFDTYHCKNLNIACILHVTVLFLQIGHHICSHQVELTVQFAKE